MHCFYATTPGSVPFKTESKWYENVDLSLDLLHKHITHSNTQECLLSKIIKLTQEEPPSKKQKLSESGKLSHLSSTASEDDAASSLGALVPPPTPAQDVCYWNSSKANKLFRPTPKERDALYAIKNQIKILKDANEAPHSYLNIVKSNEEGEINHEEMMDYTSTGI